MSEYWSQDGAKGRQGKGIICTNIIAGIKMVDSMDRLMREFWMGFFLSFFFQFQFQRDGIYYLFSINFFFFNDLKNYRNR